MNARDREVCQRLTSLFSTEATRAGERKEASSADEESPNYQWQWGHEYAFQRAGNAVRAYCGQPVQRDGKAAYAVLGDYGNLVMANDLIE